ncbi:MAG: 4Fe-4S dicluster domain-containing protein [Firmicutes bacterium]|nr:4Fe-4S dicluster domain-containing protein [Bacillota bacterium]
MSPRKIVLRFGPEISDKPIIYRLVKDYDLVMNIVKANVNPQKEGIMVLELTGDNYEQGLKYLREQGVTVQALTHEVVRNEQRCTHCGACTAICPTGALYLDRPGMEVHFDGDSCVICQLCVKACPVRAMEVKL